MIRLSLILISGIALLHATGAAQSPDSNRTADYGALMTPEQIMRELGPHTGILSGDNAYEGRTIKRVAVRYKGSGRTVSESRIKNLLSTRPGGKYFPDTVNKDLERLLESGLVAGNTSIIVEPEADGVEVIFEVSSQNLLAGVGFKGNTEFTRNELAEECDLHEGEPLSDKVVSKALNKLRTYYHEARYPDVQITYSYQKTERPGFVDVIFNIAEGPKANIINIEFSGNKNISSQDLRKVMKTKEKGWLTWITQSGMIDREQIADDLAEIITYYRDHGYLRAKLDKVEYLNSSRSKEQKLTMRIHVTEGRKYKVNKVAFSPTKVFTAKELVPALSMYNGDTYSAKKVADDITMLRRYYGSRGYADASIRPDIQETGIDPATGLGMIDIVYNITEGSPYKVGHIRVTGNTRTKDYVIRQELPLQSNDPMNSVDLETAQKRLQNLNYFDMVDISQSASARPGYRDVNIEVAEKRTGMLNLGVAFSSIESVYLFAGITQSNFDMYDWPSFIGGGQRFAINARVGFETQDASISWVDPWFLHQKLAFGTDIFYSNSTYYSDYYDQQNYGFGVSLRKPLGELQYLKMEYRLEQYSIDTERGAPIFFQQQKGDYLRSHIELTYTFDSRDAQIFPRKGGKFELLAGYSGLGGDVQTYNFGVNASRYFNLRGDTIFSLNAGLATVDSFGGHEVPIFERLYLGGPYNMRGFRFRDVAPYNPALSGDETMGGGTSFFCQFEFSIPVIEEVRLAFFYDIGFVNGDSFDFSTSKIVSDYGVGLRLNLPVGPLAVDYAIPVQKNNAIDRGGQFQFYLNYSY